MDSTTLIMNTLKLRFIRILWINEPLFRNLCFILLNQLLFLQTFIFLIISTYRKLTNILTLWYAAGVYLITLGLLLLRSNSDIFVGFLWVIDFGVGLIFFIFILHFSSFLYQKALIDVFKSSFISYFFYAALLLFCFFFLVKNQTSNCPKNFYSTWFFFVTHYNFYYICLSKNVTNLQLLREVYFYHNSFEFFVINFVLFYGIISSILLCFMLKKMFNSLSVEQFKNLNLLKTPEAVYFIRLQNFLKQQNTSTGTRVWIKNKEKKKYDF